MMEFPQFGTLLLCLKILVSLGAHLANVGGRIEQARLLNKQIALRAEDCIFL